MCEWMEKRVLSLQRENERNYLKGERERETRLLLFSLAPSLPFSFLLLIVVPVLEWFDPSFSSFPSTFTLVLLVFFLSLPVVPSFSSSGYFSLSLLVVSSSFF